MRKLLLIAYHFPPDAAIGAVRPAKFAQYLPEFGWEPTVLTVKEEHYDNRDPDRMVPALDRLELYRLSLLPGPLQLYSTVKKRMLQDEGCRFKVEDERKEKKFLKAQRNNESAGGVSTANPARSLRRLVSSLLRLPDVYQGWIINIALAGRRIMKKEGIDTFMTSGPPMSTHLGGLLVKLMTGASWMVDFRDPWMSMLDWQDQRFRTEWCNRIEGRLEQMVISKADHVITTTPSLAGYFQSLLTGEQKKKVSVIMNGYDDDDFEGLCVPEIPSHKIRICHAGALYLGRNPEPLFRALSRLIEIGAVDRNTIELEFIGNADFNGYPLSLLAEKYDLMEQVILTGKTSFHESLRKQMSSQALLLLAQKQPYAIPGKAFEYLRMGKPTLAIIDEGDTKDLLLSFPGCFVADPNQDGQIEDRLLEMLDSIKVRNGNGRYTVPYIERFSRRKLTGQLASLLSQRL